MNELTRRLNDQDDMLREILTAIKGNKELGVDGLVTKQEDFMTTIEAEIRQIKKRLDDLNKWKDGLMTYLGLATSKRLWKTMFYVLVAIGVIYMVGKFGLEYVLELAKRWLK